MSDPIDESKEDIPRRVDVKRFSLKGSVSLAVSFAAMPLIALVTSPILARVLGPESRGEVAAISAPITLAESFAAWGLPLAAAYFVARGTSSRALVRAALPFAIAAGVISYVMLFIFAPTLLHATPQLIGLFRAASLYVILSAVIALIRGVRNGEERYGLLGIERWVQALTRLLLIVVFAWFGVLTTTTAVWLNIGAAVLAGALLFGPLASVTRAGVEFSRLVLAKYSFSSWGTQIASAANARLDQALLIAFVSAPQLGLYVVAAMAAELPMTVFSAVQKVVIGSASGPERRPRVLRASRICFGVGLCVVMVGVPVAPLAVRILFGTEYEDAGRLLQILLVGVLPWGVGQVLTGALVASDLPKLASRSEFASLGLTLIGIVTVAPVYGVIGAAWVSVSAYVLAFGLKLYFFCRKTRVPVVSVVVPNLTDARWVLSKLQRS